MCISIKVYDLSE